MFLTYTNSLVNELDTGATQIIQGHRKEAGFWVFEKEYFLVYLPHNDKGRVVPKIIDGSLAISINWHKIYDLILDCWKNNKIDSWSIEKDKPVDLLLKIGAADNLNGDIVFKQEYMYTFTSTQEESLPIIDITETANPRKEEEDEE